MTAIGYTISRSRQRFMLIQSDQVPVGEGGEQGDILDIPTSDFPHCFIQLRLWDSEGAPLTPADITASKFTVYVQTIGNPYWESIPGGSWVWPLTELDTLSWNANTRSVRLELTTLGKDDPISFFSFDCSFNRT